MKSIVFDCETTGLLSNHLIKIDRQPHVIEFYACSLDLETGDVEKEIELLLKPPSLDAVTDEISKITGITREMLMDRPSFADAADAIASFLESGGEVIAHNLGFDKEMIEIEMERAGKKVTWPRRLRCTVEATEWVKGHRLNLESLHEELFGSKFSGAHRAKTDVSALVKCCIEMRKRMWI